MSTSQSIISSIILSCILYYTVYGYDTFNFESRIFQIQFSTMLVREHLTREDPVNGMVEIIIIYIRFDLKLRKNRFVHKTILVKTVDK